MEEKNTNKLNNQEIDDDQAGKVTGGYRGLFPKWQIIKTYCDFCNRKIDGQSLYAVPIITGKHMCNECFEKQKKILGEDVANEKWMGFNKNIKRSESKVDVTNRNK